ncbi:uncharacterized protein V6R79_006605 [Siganus canaliculatus]
MDTVVSTRSRYGGTVPPATTETRGWSLKSLTSLKVLCKKRHFLLICLILLVVYVAIDTFVYHQTRNDPPALGFTDNKQGLLSAVKNVWEGRHADSSVSGKQAMTSQQTDGPADYRHQKQEHETQLDDKQSNHINEATVQNLITGSTPSNSIKAGTVNIETACHPKSHIVFLKTHKTASSTILNILYRYGEKRNLTFALPSNHNSQLYYPSFFASHFVEGVSSKSVTEFHIMCNHMRFRKSEVAKVMPEDTFYFSVLRHPVELLESAFIYYKSLKVFANSNDLENFLDNVQRDYNSSVQNSHYAHNILAFDFGLNNDVAVDAPDFEDTVKRTIASIESDFHLILITEYFEESMILLKHSLCWSLEDVLSFKLNSRSNKTRHTVSQSTADKIKRWNALDWRIYLHFNTTFWHKVDSLVGQEQMKREISELRALEAELVNTCLKDGKAVHPSQIKDAGLKPFQYGAAVIEGYILNTDIDEQTRINCQRLVTPELQYTQLLYNQQFAKQTKT